MTHSRTIWFSLVALLAFSGALPMAAHGEESVAASGVNITDALAAKVIQLEAELAQVRSQMHSGMTANYEGRV